jgi:hypothetical protein
MAYTLIPEGFTLKKVTRAEKDAVDEYFGRERRGTYLEGLLSNTSTPTVLAAASLPLIIGFILNTLKEEGVNITDEILDKILALLLGGIDIIVPETEVGTGPGGIKVFPTKIEEAQKFFKEYTK